MTGEPQIAYVGMGAWPLYVGFSTSSKAFAREMKRLGIKSEPFVCPSHATATTHITRVKGCLTCIITLRPKGRSPEQIAGLIAHEATHVVQELWKAISEGEPGPEAEAYLVQHIVQSCLEQAWKTGRTKKEAP